MTTELTGKRLLQKLSGCPSDAYPNGITESELFPNVLLVSGDPVDADAIYDVRDDVHQRDAESVNTIDTDWSVWIH